MAGRRTAEGLVFCLTTKAGSQIDRIPGDAMRAVFHVDLSGHNQAGVYPAVHRYGLTDSVLNLGTDTILMIKSRLVVSELA